MQALKNLSFLFLFSAFIYGLPMMAQEIVTSKKIDRNMVCMVDDDYKGEQQLETTINNKVFFGCCEPCIELLLTDSTFHFAIDPNSGSKVCKADAYIVIKPGEISQVLYFESEDSYEDFTKSRE